MFEGSLAHQETLKSPSSYHQLPPVSAASRGHTYTEATNEIAGCYWDGYVALWCSCLGLWRSNVNNEITINSHGIQPKQIRTNDCWSLNICDCQPSPWVVINYDQSLLTVVIDCESWLSVSSLRNIINHVSAQVSTIGWRISAGHGH